MTDHPVLGSVVRQVVTNVDPHVKAALDQAAIREWKSGALHCQLDLRRPEKTVSTALLFAGRGRPLPDVVRSYLNERPISPEVQRDALLALADEMLEFTADGVHAAV
jgi:hypothetical protein